MLRSHRETRRLITAQREPRKLEWASPIQQLVFNHGPSPLLMSGGFNAAKTFVGCLKALFLSDLYPGNRGVIVRGTWEHMKKTTMETFFQLCPPEAYALGRRADSDKVLRLNNGSEIIWLHLDDQSSEKIARGLEINWFLMDQAEEIKEDIADLLMTRLGRWPCAVPPYLLDNFHRQFGRPWPWVDRLGKPLVPTYPMFTCNPDTELHWLWKRFHPDSPDRYKPRIPNPFTGKQESYADLGYQMYTMSSVENRFISKQNLTHLLSKDKTYVDRFVFGLWGMPEGQIHTVAKESIVEGTPELLEYFRQCCELHRTLDHGDTSPTACSWFAVDQDGNVFAYREYYMPDALVSQHRDNIFALSEHERYCFELADPSIFNKVQQKYGGRWCTADEYSDCNNLPERTAIFWNPADNNELGTRNRISEYLRVDPNRIHPITKERGAPRLFFVVKSRDYPSGVEHLLRETRGQRRKKIGSDLGKPVFSDDRDDSQSDHAYDTLRYFIASRPGAARAESTAHTQPGSFNAARKKLDNFQRKNGWGRLMLDARRRRIV